MTEEELTGALQFQAQEYIPIPVEEVVLDSQVTGKRVNPDGSTRQEVLLVAAQRTMITTLLSTVRQAGLRVAGIDVSSLALVRALLPETSFFADAGEPGVCRGIADISSSVSTLVVAVDGVMKFTRIVNFSSDRFARALTEARGIPFDDAQVMVQRIGLPGPLPADEEYFAEDVVQETQAVLGKVAAELAEEIRRSFDYYQGQSMPLLSRTHPQWQRRAPSQSRFASVGHSRIARAHRGSAEACGAECLRSAGRRIGGHGTVSIGRHRACPAGR